MAVQVLAAGLSFTHLKAFAQAEHPLTGRKIASVMSMSGAEWLERDEREKEELPNKALDAIGIRPGMVIGDIGAGVGYFTFRIASRVGPGGKVFATDVQPEMLSRLKQRAERAKLTNIETILSSEQDPRLPKNTFDVLLLVDVYHEFSQPQLMLQLLRPALKPNGRLVLLEYRKEDPHIPIRFEHKMSVQEAKTEVEAEGFRMVEVLKDLPRQHILVFQPNPS